MGWCRSYPVRVSLRVKQSSGQRAYLLICHPRRSIKSHQHTGLWLGLLSLYFRIRVVVNGPLRRTRSTCVISEWLVCTLASYCSDRIIMTLTMTIWFTLISQSINTERCVCDSVTSLDQVLCRDLITRAPCQCCYHNGSISPVIFTDDMMLDYDGGGPWWFSSVNIVSVEV